jgi:hypothetical protein
MGTRTRRHMSERHTSEGTGPGAGRYEIRLTGHLHERWAARFDGMAINRLDDGTSVISGPIADQSALHGLLQRVRDLGLPLLSVERVGTEAPGPTDLPPVDGR